MCGGVNCRRSAAGPLSCRRATRRSPDSVGPSSPRAPRLSADWPARSSWSQGRIRFPGVAPSIWSYWKACRLPLSSKGLDGWQTSGCDKFVLRWPWRWTARRNQISKSAPKVTTSAMLSSASFPSLESLHGNDAEESRWQRWLFPMFYLHSPAASMLGITAVS